MKATINGIEVEGTPQEIAEYQRIQNQTAPWYEPFMIPGTSKPVIPPDVMIINLGLIDEGD